MAAACVKLFQRTAFPARQIVTADQIYKGVYGVSNPGRKRGRAKGRRRPPDLNKGQIIGVGRSNMVWPGLNAPDMKDKKLIKMEQLPPNPARQEELDKLKEQRRSGGRLKVSALQRGWSGNRYPGMSVGPPDPVGEYTFEGFDTKVLEMKMVSNMTGNLGRKTQFSALVVTGNKNGLAGFAFAKAPKPLAAIRKAKTLAGSKLQFVERFQNHSVYHNFYSREKQTAIIVQKREKGHGFVGHRVIKCICHVLGIENLYCKVEGSTTNYLRITRAFFAGLQKQETHQDLANRTKLHVVEFRRDRDYVPIIQASPADGDMRTDVNEEEDLDFERLYFNGKVLVKKPRKRSAFHGMRSWHHRKRVVHRRRNQREAQIERLALGIDREGRYAEPMAK